MSKRSFSWKLEKEKGKTYSPTILFFGITKTRTRVFRKSSKREREIEREKLNNRRVTYPLNDRIP